MGTRASAPPRALFLTASFPSEREHRVSHSRAQDRVAFAVELLWPSPFREVQARETVRLCAEHNGDVHGAVLEEEGPIV